MRPEPISPEPQREDVIAHMAAGLLQAYQPKKSARPRQADVGVDVATDDALDPALADSFGFFATGTKAFNLIATFCDENRAFTNLLAHVHARFNPIAVYYQNQRKAFEIAAEGDSEEVFRHTFDAATANTGP
jgi:adenylate kinase family enzyme